MLVYWELVNYPLSTLRSQFFFEQAILEPLVDLELDQVKNVFDTNVYSALRIVKAVVPSMASRRSGLIINIGSIAGEV